MRLWLALALVAALLGIYCGGIAIVASVAIAGLIDAGLAQPHPDPRTALLISAGVATWGLIDLIRSAVPD